MQEAAFAVVSLAALTAMAFIMWPSEKGKSAEAGRRPPVWMAPGFLGRMVLRR